MTDTRPGGMHARSTVFSCKPENGAARHGAGRCSLWQWMRQGRGAGLQAPLRLFLWEPACNKQQPGHAVGRHSAQLLHPAPRTLEVWLTQITWCTSASVYLSTCVPTAGTRTPLSMRSVGMRPERCWGAVRAPAGCHDALQLQPKDSTSSPAQPSHGPPPACLVDKDAGRIGKAKERVVGKHHAVAHGARMHDRLMRHGGEGLPGRGGLAGVGTEQGNNSLPAPPTCIRQWLPRCIATDRVPGTQAQPTWCPCTRLIRSRSKMQRSRRKPPNRVGRVTACVKARRGA